MNQRFVDFDGGLFGFGGAAAFLGSFSVGSGSGSLLDLFARLLLLLAGGSLGGFGSDGLVGLRFCVGVVGITGSAAACRRGVSGCDFALALGGARRQTLGASALLHFLLEVFVGDGDVVFGRLLLECLFCCVSEAELVDDICEPDALLAVGGSVVKHAARHAHRDSAERSSCLLTSSAELASFGFVGDALGEQAVVGAKCVATALDRDTAPGNGETSLFRGFHLGFLGGLFSIGLCLGCFRGLPLELFGSLGSFLGSRFRGFLFSFHGGFLLLRECHLRGLGGLFFASALDGVAISVEFDGLLGLGLGLGVLSLDAFLDGDGGIGDFSENETTDRFHIEILTLARKNGEDDVDEFVADLKSHVGRHFREAPFHNLVGSENHGKSVGRIGNLSLGHCN